MTQALEEPKNITLKQGKTRHAELERKFAEWLRHGVWERDEWPSSETDGPTEIIAHLIANGATALIRFSKRGPPPTPDFQFSLGANDYWPGDHGGVTGLRSKHIRQAIKGWTMAHGWVYIASRFEKMKEFVLEIRLHPQPEPHKARIEVTFQGERSSEFETTYVNVE